MPSRRSITARNTALSRQTKKEGTSVDRVHLLSDFSSSLDVSCRRDTNVKYLPPLSLQPFTVQAATAVPSKIEDARNARHGLYRSFGLPRLSRERVEKRGKGNRS